MTNPKVCAAFKNGLIERGLSYEDIKKWEFCGGRSDGAQQNSNHFLYFKKCFPNYDLPDFKPVCVCGQILYVNNGYIRKDQSVLTPDEVTNEFLIIGICCTEHFIESGIKRLCDTCKVAHRSHYNTPDGNTCRKCRKILKNDQKPFKKQFKNVCKEILYNGHFEIKNPKVRAAKANAENIARIKAIHDEAKRASAAHLTMQQELKEEYENSKIIYFDFPYNFTKESMSILLKFKNPNFSGYEKESNRFTYYPELKIWFCRNTKYFKEWIKNEEIAKLQLHMFVIKNINNFRNKRESAYRAEYNIKSIMFKLNLPFNDTVTYIKRLGYYFDKNKKVWYKQY
jgi:hypothetical protein